jgi:hypothetical protein
MAVDADGDPAAYNPHGGGDDALGNAGHDGDWYGVVCDHNGKPIVQGPHDPYPGDYISQTALIDRSKAVTDPRRYVDSRTVPYVSIPSELLASKGGPLHLGDVCMVSYGDRQCAAVVGDVGPHGRYGEGSIALAKELDINPSPRHGGCDSGVTFTIFIGSSKGWPRTVEEFSEQATELFGQWGAAAL